MQSLQGGLGTCGSRQREELNPYEKNGRVMNFPSYHDGVKYQKTHHLEKSTYVLPLASKEKELYIAA